MKWIPILDNNSGSVSSCSGNITMTITAAITRNAMSIIPAVAHLRIKPVPELDPSHNTRHSG